jgi:hypothetical protein
MYNFETLNKVIMSFNKQQLGKDAGPNKYAKKPSKTPPPIIPKARLGGMVKGKKGC